MQINTISIIIRLNKNLYDKEAWEVMEKRYDKIIIGAGLYGLYAALFCCKRGQNVLVLECDKKPFGRATYVNQARVHQGYHYPRSLATAVKSAHYFERFYRDYQFCIYKEFHQIYAVSSQYSWSDGEQFKTFCEAADIPCEELHPERFFKKGMCDSAFETREYTYDAMILKEFFLEELSKFKHIDIFCDVMISRIERLSDAYDIYLDDGRKFQTGYLLNTSYAAANQILSLAGFEMFPIKYELCEIILCQANETLKNYGFTVMDGPFFSIMPFGKTGFHSLTSVTFTPHMTSYDALPKFPCQKMSGGYCTNTHLGNCSYCPKKPLSAFPYMAKLAEKYLREEYGFRYHSSLFSMKPILMSSEIDDSRPTVIRISSQKPTFVSVLSGKINTVYDLDEVLCNETV